MPVGWMHSTDAGEDGGGGTARLYKLPAKNANRIELMEAGGGGEAAESSSCIMKKMKYLTWIQAVFSSGVIFPLPSDIQPFLETSP